MRFRIHSQSSIISSDGNDDLTQNVTFQQRRNAQNRTLQKWCLQWKSIIRSSLGNTSYPYCLYIRSLDLRNLKELLEDPLFRETALDTFFADDMASFSTAPSTPMKSKMRNAKGSYTRLDVPAILERVGESITSYISEAASVKHTTVAVEELSGEISAEALSRWAGRLAKLKSMTLWDGSALNEGTALAIANKCYDFDDLTFFTCSKPDADHDLSSFFSALRINTLQSFTALGAHAVGPETLLTLNHHAASLRKLKLDGLKAGAIKNLSLLQGCKALELLEIQDAEGSVDLEATENDVYLETVSWLCGCDSIKELTLRNLVNGPKILTQVCLRNNIRLKKLHVDGYSLVHNQDFHKSLIHQNTLESLELRADPEGAFRDDIDTLVNSISHIPALKYLNLLSCSDYFRTLDIQGLVRNLSNIEELWFGGYDVNDVVWPALANLPHLRALNIHAMSSFSYEGILGFIGSLKDTNQGLLLSIMNQTSDHTLTAKQEATIRKELATKVDGVLDFTLFREADSESESFSD